MTAPDPPLADDLITLRPWTRDDIPAIVSSCNDPLLPRFIPVLPMPYTESDAEQFLARRSEPLELHLAIADAGGAVLGSVGVAIKPHDTAVAEIGYWLAAEARGRGAATRALVLLSRWALGELPLARLQLTTDVENTKSQRVAERGGFAREGILRAWYDRRGERRDAVMYSLVPGEQ